MPPPRIIKHPMDVTIPPGVAVVFTCVGQGYGLVDVNWFKGNMNSKNPPPETSTVNTMITPNNITTITSILTIPDVNDKTPNRYRCIFNNSEGEIDSTIARLTIGGKDK